MTDPITYPPTDPPGYNGCLERGVFPDEMKLNVLKPRGMTNATVAGGPAPGTPEERELLVLEPGGDINQVRGWVYVEGCVGGRV